MAAVNCVKISYKGLTRHILCNTKFQFDELIKTVMDKFNIESSCELAIEFYDEQGHKYTKDTFEYLLLLFPNPQKIFFVRLDSSKLIKNNPAMVINVDRLPFGKSTRNNQQTTTNESDHYCEAVPVRRQNCFLGEMPDSASAQQQDATTTLNCNQSRCLSLEIAKRLRQLEQSPPKKKRLNNPNLFKRSLRI